MRYEKFQGTIFSGEEICKHALKVNDTELKLKTLVTSSVVEIDNELNINEHTATRCEKWRDIVNTTKRHI